MTEAKGKKNETKDDSLTKDEAIQKKSDDDNGTADVSNGDDDEAQAVDIAALDDIFKDPDLPAFVAQQAANLVLELAGLKDEELISNEAAERLAAFIAEYPMVSAEAIYRTGCAADLINGDVDKYQELSEAEKLAYSMFTITFVEATHGAKMVEAKLEAEKPKEKSGYMSKPNKGLERK